MSTSTNESVDALPCDGKYYSHSYQIARDNQIMAFESPFFGLQIDRSDLASLHFSQFDPKEMVPYIESLKKECRGGMDQLSKVEFTIQIKIGENIYSVTNAIQKPRLWEAGRITQRFEYGGLQFEGLCSFNATLWVVVWPDSFTFQVAIRGTDEELQPLSDGFQIKIQFLHWSVEKSFDISRTAGIREKEDQKEFSVVLPCNLTSNLDNLKGPDNGVDIEALAYSETQLETEFNHEFNCFFINLGKWVKRPFEAMWTDIRDYDSIEVTIQNKGSDKVHVPIVLYVQNLANPTGVCAIVCDGEYGLTGIPMQVSKNWHIKGIPAYGYFYSYLPVNAGTTTTYRIRLAYGFWGSLPSASHGNLSLVGYGNCVSRWEQLAIGCWGETICFDPDMALVPRTITDLRTLLVKKGENGKKWRFSDAGWGGDWLDLSIHGERQKPFQWKFGYLSHGPCLSEVKYAGWYGNEKTVSLESSISTLRTDDYARTFCSIRYEFNKRAHTDVSFFVIGGDDHLYTPMIAWGNKEGLIEERSLEKKNPGHLYLEQQNFDGPGPFWFGFPKQEIRSGDEKGHGWRAIVIRSFEASFGGVRYNKPTFSVCNKDRKQDFPIDPNGIFMLRPPQEVTHISQGDWVSLDVSVITLPPNADEYYGPNMSLRRHLIDNSNSWKTVHREATENIRSVEVHSGGEVVSAYPIIISVFNQYMVKMIIQGGIGAVPLQFKGLQSHLYTLYHCTDEGEIPIDRDQTVHGKDFYQVEYRYDKDENSKVIGYYCITFNVILDDINSSTWVLRKVDGSL